MAFNNFQQLLVIINGFQQFSIAFNNYPGINSFYRSKITGMPQRLTEGGDYGNAVRNGNALQADRRGI
jgi:hypothetical protein